MMNVSMTLTKPQIDHLLNLVKDQIAYAVACEEDLAQWEELKTILEQMRKDHAS